MLKDTVFELSFKTRVYAIRQTAPTHVKQIDLWKLLL